MESTIDKNLFVRICEYGIKHPDGFTINELCESLDVSKDSWEYVVIHLHAVTSLHSGRADWGQKFNPELNTIFQVIKYIHPETKLVTNIQIDQPITTVDVSIHFFILKSTTVFDYLDFKEYEGARKASKKATCFAIISICITGITFFLQYCQKTKIDEEQFKLISSKIDSNRISRTNSILLLDSVLKTTINDHIRIHETKRVNK